MKVHADLTPEELKNTVLSELEPEYRAFRNRDYNRLKTGAPPRPEELVDIPEGGITVLSVAECALECTKTPNCNAASWYGASPSWADVRNCWLKTLKPACQLPADAERHSDNRAFLIARPRECELSPRSVLRLQMTSAVRLDHPCGCSHLPDFLR